MNQVYITTNIVCDTINNNNNKNKTEVFIDPATMMMIASIIIDLIKIVKKCKTAQEIATSANAPTVFEKRVVYRQIKKHLSWKDYFKKRSAIANAIFNTGAQMEIEDMTKLFEEINI